MPYEETAASFHPWDRGMILVGAFVVGMAFLGVIAAPALPDARRAWRCHFLWAGAAIGIFAIGFAGYYALRALVTSRDFRLVEFPVDFARWAIPALEYAAIGCIGLLALAGAALLSGTVAGRGRAPALAGVVLLALPFLSSLFPWSEQAHPSFGAIPPLPESAVCMWFACHYGMMVLGIACLAAMALMALSTGDSGGAGRARRFGLQVGLAELGLATVFIHLLWIEVLRGRAVHFGVASSSLWSELLQATTGSAVVTGALLLGTGAVAMAGFRRGGDEAPPP